VAAAQISRVNCGGMGGNKPTKATCEQELEVLGCRASHELYSDYLFLFCICFHFLHKVLYCNNQWHNSGVARNVNWGPSLLYPCLTPFFPLILPPSNPPLFFFPFLPLSFLFLPSLPLSSPFSVLPSLRGFRSRTP